MHAFQSQVQVHNREEAYDEQLDLRAAQMDKSGHPVRPLLCRAQISTNNWKRMKSSMFSKPILPCLGGHRARSHEPRRERDAL